MQENSVQKHYLNLRWFLNWAIRRGYASEKEIGKIQPKFKLGDKPIIFLTKEELLKLYNYVISANGSKVKLHNYYGTEYEKVVHDAGPLSKTRDMFCFWPFTSLRYSDMANLKRTDIAGDTMYITTQKNHAGFLSTSTFSPRRFLPSTKTNVSQMALPCQSSPTRR